MTDRELLELAAKAAGYWLRSKREPEFQSDQVWISDQDLSGVRYIPQWRVFDSLIDKEDAFDLMTKLRFEIVPLEAGGVDVLRWEDGVVTVQVYEYDTDDGVATRRAITRAAAEIQLTRERA